MLYLVKVERLDLNDPSLLKWSLCTGQAHLS